MKLGDVLYADGKIQSPFLQYDRPNASLLSTQLFFIGEKRESHPNNRRPLFAGIE